MRVPLWLARSFEAQLRETLNPLSTMEILINQQPDWNWWAVHFNGTSNPVAPKLMEKVGLYMCMHACWGGCSGVTGSVSGRPCSSRPRTAGHAGSFLCALNLDMVFHWHRRRHWPSRDTVLARSMCRACAAAPMAMQSWPHVPLPNLYCMLKKHHVLSPHARRWPTAPSGTSSFSPTASTA